MNLVATISNEGAVHFMTYKGTMDGGAVHHVPGAVA